MFYANGYYQRNQRNISRIYGSQPSRAQEICPRTTKPLFPQTLPRKLVIVPYIENENNKHCNICLENFIPNKNIAMTPCLHAFHIDCIEEWKQHSTENGNTIMTCPVCRIVIFNKL